MGEDPTTFLTLGKTQMRTCDHPFRYDEFVEHFQRFDLSANLLAFPNCEYSLDKFKNNRCFSNFNGGVLSIPGVHVLRFIAEMEELYDVYKNIDTSNLEFEHLPAGMNLCVRCYFDEKFAVRVDRPVILHHHLCRGVSTADVKDCGVRIKRGLIRPLKVPENEELINVAAIREFASEFFRNYEF